MIVLDVRSVRTATKMTSIANANLFGGQTMFTFHRLSPLVLGLIALSTISVLSLPVQADRYDDPTEIVDEISEPVDSSENHAVVTLDFA